MFRGGGGAGWCHVIRSVELLRRPLAPHPYSCTLAGAAVARLSSWGQLDGGKCLEIDVEMRLPLEVNMGGNDPCTRTVPTTTVRSPIPPPTVSGKMGSVAIA